MKPEELQYVEYRLERSCEALSEAQLLIEHEHFNAAVNRMYYACFYVVSALLYTEGYASSKHSGVKALFDQHWINTQRLSVSLGKFYRQLFNRRQESDYGDYVKFDRADVDSWLLQTKDFLDNVSLAVKQKISE